MGQMKNKIKLLSFVLIVMMFVFPLMISAKEKEEKKKAFDVPGHALNISKENTFPNSSEDQEVIEPSKLTKELIDQIEIPIENPDLIKLLNETSLKPSPLAIGYRGEVYLGRWALNYESIETTINWEFQQINENELNNIGGDSPQIMHYNQMEKKEIQGALTNKITNPTNIKDMMLMKTIDKTKLPLSFQTVIGENTKKDQEYNIPAEKQGYLKAYAPAVNEKGQATFGEVYIKLTGAKKSIIIKNVTKQGIGAWIPIQDYVSLSFQLK